MVLPLRFDFMSLSTSYYWSLLRVAFATAGIFLFIVANSGKIKVWTWGFSMSRFLNCVVEKSDKVYLCPLSNYTCEMVEVTWKAARCFFYVASIV